MRGLSRLKLFVSKILTSKLFDIRILQTFFCKTRAQQDFRKGRGGGDTLDFRLREDEMSHSGEAS
jgi:hypothetical protein